MPENHRHLAPGVSCQSIQTSQCAFGFVIWHASAFSHRSLESLRADSHSNSAHMYILNYNRSSPPGIRVLWSVWFNSNVKEQLLGFYLLSQRTLEWSYFVNFRKRIFSCLVFAATFKYMPLLKHCIMLEWGYDISFSISANNCFLLPVFTGNNGASKENKL